jgi:hypothetical protein
MSGNIYNSFYSYTFDRLIGLIISCPFIESEPNCPLQYIRKGKLKERLVLMKKMSPEELLRIEEHHVKCLRKREQQRNPLS